MASRNTALWDAVCKQMGEQIDNHCAEQEITYGMALQMVYDSLDKLCEEGNVSGRMADAVAKLVLGAYNCGKIREIMRVIAST